MKKQKSTENEDLNKTIKKNNKDSEDCEDDQIFKLVSTIVQWYLVLEEITSERANESYFQSSRAKCQCDKAKEIIEKCSELQKSLDQIIQKDKTKNQAELRRTLKATEEEVRDLGASLRSNISIQIPSSAASSDSELSRRAGSLVLSGSVGSILLESMTGVIQYTEELFNTASCKHEKLTVKKFISPLLGNMPRLSPRGKVRKAEDDGNPSRPKRFRAARKSMDEESGFRPYKPPPPSPDVLNLLEKKKKLVKKNGLYQFVLWREAIRGERDRVTETEVRSSKKFLAMARKRKRSPFQSVRNKI